jgi:hypothetical protein
MLLPAGDGDVARMNDTQLRRLAIMTDWFSDPDFFAGRDTVCLICRIAEPNPSTSLAAATGAECSSCQRPTQSTRRHFPGMACRPSRTSAAIPVPAESGTRASDEQAAESLDSLAEATAGLSMHAVRQLLLVSGLQSSDQYRETMWCTQVEHFIQAQLGEKMSSSSKTEASAGRRHRLHELQEVLADYMLPRLRLPDDRALPGAAVAGPIGGGKTFIFEAVAAELDMPVLVLKSIRSQWFGQTDVIFERLKRVLEALEKVVIFVDEADTQFGGVGEGSHETERRLTGKIQGMMSDPQLRGKVIWLLMTARIHLLPPTFDARAVWGT